MAAKNEETAKKRIKDGWIHVLTTFEIIGKPQEHVDETIKQLIETVKKEEDKLQFIESHIESSVATEDGFFSTFAEVDMIVKNVESLTWLAANYTPATIEIIEPLDFKFTAGELQAWYSDILSTLHTIGYTHKTQNAELAHLKSQLRILIDNSLLLSLSRGKKTVEQLSKDTSIDSKAVEGHIAALEKAGKVTHAKGVYALK